MQYSNILLVTQDEDFANALGRALKILRSANFTMTESLRGTPGDRSDSLVLDIGPERDGYGTLEGFYLLRYVLMGRDSFNGPIALVCSENRIFEDDRRRIPDAERVRLFSVPFLLEEFLTYLTDGPDPKHRRYTRMFLRGRLSNDDIRVIAGGDTHRLAHFDPLVLAVEAALYEGNREAFVCPGEGMVKGVYYTNRLLAAQAMLESLRELAGKQELTAAVSEGLKRLEETCGQFGELAFFLDQTTSNEAVPENKWPSFVSRLKREFVFDVRGANFEWAQSWQRVCQLLGKRTGL